MTEVEPVGAKLERWDEYAPLALRFLIDWLRESPNEILAVARGRHVWGHYRFGDRNYAEYDSDRLLAETVEELGDAVNYIARRIYLEERATLNRIKNLPTRCIP